MNWNHFELIFTFLVLAGVFICLVKEWFPMALSALGGMSILLLFGILDDADLKAVFSNAAPLTIGAMFVLAEALSRTGVVDWIAHNFESWAGRSISRALVILALIVMPLSAFMNNTPVVVVFLPVLMAFSRKTGLKATKLLIPLSFFSILGGTMTLIGTSTNLLVAGVAENQGQRPFGIFEITGLGVIYAAIGFLYMHLIGSRLLPARDTVASLLDAEDTRKFCSAVEIPEDSPLIGHHLVEHPLFADQRKTIVYEVVRYGRRVDDIPLDAMVLHAGDVLWFRANSKKLAEIKAARGVTMLQGKPVEGSEDNIPGTEVKTVEAIISAQSNLVGHTIRESSIRRHYGVVVAAVHRKGIKLSEGYQDIKLAFGDTLLLEGPVHNLVRMRQEEDFLSLNELEFTPPRKAKALVATAILAAVVIGSACDLMSITAAAIIGAVLAIATRCVEMNESYRSIEWNVLFLIYGMLGIGMAMEKTGGAALIAHQMVEALDAFGPVVILAAIYLLASLLTEFVTNNAVAILLTPVVIVVAADLGVDPRPFIVAIMFGASASFMTPVGYQTNTYVFGAGGYSFADFMKVGVPLNLLLWGAATLCIPWFWPF